MRSSASSTAGVCFKVYSTATKRTWARASKWRLWVAVLAAQTASAVGLGAAGSGGLRFDGENDFVSFGQAPGLGAATFTLETWFNWTGGGQAVVTGAGGIEAIPLVAKGRGEADGNTLDMNYLLGVRPGDGVLVADLEEGASGSQPGLNRPVAGSTSVTPGVWHHAAVTYDGSAWRLYLDGVLDAQLTVGQPPRADSVQHASLGSALDSGGNASGFFAGVLDEARIWNYARSGAQIAQDKDIQIASAPGLIGRWSLDDGSGLTARDSAGGGIDGTLRNGPVWVDGYQFDSPPTVTITAPGAGAVFFTPLDLAIATTVSDSDGQVVRVDFYAGTNQLGSVVASPFVFSWNAVPPGYYTLVAVATDDTFLSSTSAPVRVVVQNPIVQITSPAHEARYIERDAIPIEAEASDSGGTITVVEFLAGPLKLGEDTSRPFSLAWDDASPGVYALRAVAMNAGGIRSTSAAVSITVASNRAPTITLTSPLEGARLYAPTNVVLAATAADSDGMVVRVEFYQGNTKLGETGVSPYQLVWPNPALGSYALRAVATDDRGFSATSAVLRVTVEINSAPTVFLTEPCPGQGFIAPANINLAAEANDPDGISRVEFYQGANRLGEDATAPYRFSWNSVPAGQYQLRAVATDLFGLGATSGIVSVVVTNNDPPLVLLTSPTNNGIFHAPVDIRIEAEASDDDGIVRVEFYANSAKLGEALSRPYALTWSDPEGGSYSLRAVATDGAGVMSTSAPINLTVVGAVRVATRFVPFGSVWRYRDDGVDQGTNWIGANFDDEAWGSGPAQLGYSTASPEGDEATVLNFGPDVNNKFVTYYFRRAFVATNVAFLESVELALLRDDGGVVYLNGVEIHRAALPSGEIRFGTLATASGENSVDRVPVPPGLVREGTNILAAEIHQASPASSDLSFDLELGGILVNAVPAVLLTSPAAGATFSAPADIALQVLTSDPDGSVAKVEYYQNGLFIGESTSAPFSFLWAGVNFGGAYRLEAVATDNQGSRATSAVVNVTVLGNFQPAVQVTAPADQSAFLVPTNLLVSASASDSDGTVTNVVFYAEGVRVGEDRTRPFSVMWSNAVPGVVRLTAVAYDNQGATATSGVVRVTFQHPPPPGVLVAAGSVWKYLDDGSDQGVEWREPGFDDFGWAQGPGQLGFGDGDEATLLSRYGTNGQESVTFYFRRSFTVPDPSGYKALWIRLLRDDGAVVYVNGAEAWRSNMPLPPAPIDYQTLANNTATGVEESTYYYSNSLSPAVLRAGLNVVAVEVHQGPAVRTDLTFDLELTGRTTNLAPTILLTSPGDNSVYTEPANILLEAAAADADGAVAKVQFFHGSTLLGEDSVPPYTYIWQNVPQDLYELNARAWDTLGAGATSEVVRVMVMASSSPLVDRFEPAPGTVGSLTVVTVRFTEPVDGVDAADLLVNGRPASALTGSESVYTFDFPQPLEGPVSLRWAAGHGIVDREESPKPFSGTGPGQVADYQLVDLSPPQMAMVTPVQGAALSSLARVSILFSEPVGGIHPGDLLLNDRPASSVSGSGPGPYRFEFDSVPDQGTVLVRWSTDHGIHDFARAENNFAGGSWNYRLDPGLAEAALVINEIMYHPGSQNDAEEYIELFNPGATALELAGWTISGGVNFAFPAVTLGPGAYLVVAADLGVFSGKYPGVTNVVGGWTGRLSNTDEEIELEDALGRLVDQVHYADQGDWAIRQPGPLSAGSRGWEWFASHDGQATDTSSGQVVGSRSLELLNPALPNNTGQNWAASLPGNGTPGTANSVASADIAPLVQEVACYPAVPRSSDTIIITATVRDEAAGGAVVTLFHRDHSTTSPPGFAALPMRDDGLSSDGLAGDGSYGVVLPARPHGTVIEFYVEARDTAGHARTWPAAARQLNGSYAQTANALCQVDDEVYTGGLPLFRLILTETERLELENINRSSDAEMNATLVASDGTGTRVRHNVGVRIRGSGTRARTPPNYRVNIPTDRRWKGLTEMNLNTQFIHSQIAGSAIARQAGLPSASAQPVQVRRNGVNLVTRSDAPPNGTSSGHGFSSYAFLEAIGADWAGKHFPGDGNGNAYRAAQGWGAQLDYRGPNPGSYQGDYSKASNQSENDWTDLINLTYALSPNTADRDYLEALSTNANVRLWMRYFAVCTLLEYSENGLATGVGDDYNLYRGINDPRFLLVPHDFDTVLGQGDTAGNVNESIWLVIERQYRPEIVQVFSRLMYHNEIAPIYFDELTRLLDTTFSPAQMNPLLDQVLGHWVPGPKIDEMKDFALRRAAGVRAQIPSTFSVNLSLPVVSGYYQASSPSLSLSGRANAVRTRSVRLAGNLAGWTAYRGAWSGEVQLQPGLNRVVVEALDGAGQQVDHQTLDIWYEDGSVETAPATLDANTTWTAAGGPYLVTGNLVVPAGLVLVIEPGTTLYFAQGASLTVQGQLLAQGAASKRIRMTRQPGTSAAWGGLRFVGTSADNRLTHADLEYAGTADPITLNNSALLIDNVTWTGTTRTIIDLNNSSLIVRHSVFPTIDNNETIHGVGMPPAGHVIIEGNIFGGTTGYSDIIDFTGGRRPGPIIQILNNLFDGGSDDALDLDGTDAHIEGNVFANIHKDNSSDSSSNAIATDSGSELTVARNLFYNLDHGVLLKNDSFLVAQNNTFVGCRFGAISFDETNRTVNPGRGAFLEGNILWNNGSDFDHYYYNHPTEGTVEVVVRQSILGSTQWPAAPTWNGVISVDPLFVNGTNDFRLAAGSPARGAGPNGLDMGAFVPAGATIAGEPMSPSPLREVSLTVGGPGITAYRYRLNGGEFGPESAVGDPLQLGGLAEGVYTVEVIGKNSASVWEEEEEATVSRTWIVNTAVNALRISEVLAQNDTAVPVESRHPDLVELHNTGSAPLDLGGVSLTDNKDAPRKFVFPLGTILDGGRHLVLYADNETSPAGFHLGFSLRADGDDLRLFSKNGQPLDAVVFGPQIPDYSIGRLPDGQWALTQPTFGSPNLAAPTGDPKTLLINEWLAAGASPITEDFIELFNPGPLPVSLAGLYLSDAPDGAPARHQIPPLSFIAPGGYRVLVADGDPEAGPDHLGFRLAAEQGMIGLFTSDLVLIDSVLYLVQEENISQGRSPNGSAQIGPLATATPGSPNPKPPVPGGLQIVLNEVLAKNVSLSLTNLFGAAWAGRTPDWIELYNPTTSEIDLAGMSLSDDSLLPRKYVFPAGLSIPSGGYWVILCDDTAPASASNTGFDISANGDTIYLYDQPANGGSLLDSIAYGVQAKDFSVGRFPDGADGWILTLATPRSRNLEALVGDPANLRINEWMADPGSGDDWFEIHNADPRPVALGGLYLTDDLSTPQTRTRFQIAPLSFIGTDLYGFERFVADDNVGAGPEHVNFRLSRSGESIGLRFSADQAIDTVTFGLQTTGVSEGRLPDGQGSVVAFPDTPTPGDANFLPLTTVVINEALSHSNDPFEDAIELHNTSPAPADISGWFLSDSRRNLKKFQIPNGTVLPPGGFAVFYEYQFNPDPSEPTSFSLDSARGDQVHLSTAGVNGELTGYRAVVEFGAAAPDVPFGRFTNSVGRVDFVALSGPTFGADEPETAAEFRLGTGAPNLYPAIGPAVLNEIMYHPLDVGGTNLDEIEEFIELHNITGFTLPLYDPQHPSNTWRLGRAVEFDFPPSTAIEANGFLLVVGFDPVLEPEALAAFRAAYGGAVHSAIVGPYRGKLNNGGERVALYRPDSPEPPGDPDAGFVPYVLVEEVAYSDAFPWDSMADGRGYSLQRIDPLEYGNDPRNWLADVPTPGPAALPDSDGDGMPDQYELAHDLNPNFDDAAADLDGDGLSNIAEYYAGTRPDDPADTLRVQISLNGAVRLSFQTAPDRAYTVEYRDSLSQGAWRLLGVVPAQPTSRVEQMTDSTPGDARFYRLRLAHWP